MSVEDARNFLSNAVEDPELLERVAAAPRGERDAVARSAGYEFTEEELREARDEIAEARRAGKTGKGGLIGDVLAQRSPALEYGVVDAW